MPKGRVVFFDMTKGYGFISPDTGGADCFVRIEALHASGIKALNSEEEVIYDVLTARNGKRSAINLKFPPNCQFP